VAAVTPYAAALVDVAKALRKQTHGWRQRARGQLAAARGPVEYVRARWRQQEVERWADAIDGYATELDKQAQTIAHQQAKASAPQPKPRPWWQGALDAILGSRQAPASDRRP